MCRLSVSRYKEYTDLWRRAAARYGGAKLLKTKKSYWRHCRDLSRRLGDITQRSVERRRLFIVEPPAQDYAGATAHLVARNEGVRRNFACGNRRNPANTTLSYLSAVRRGEKLTHLVSESPLPRFALVVPIFYGAIVKPVSETATSRKCGTS